MSTVQRDYLTLKYRLKHQPALINIYWQLKGFPLKERISLFWWLIFFLSFFFFFFCSISLILYIRTCFDMFFPSFSKKNGAKKSIRRQKKNEKKNHRTTVFMSKQVRMWRISEILRKRNENFTKKSDIRYFYGNPFPLQNKAIVIKALNPLSPNSDQHQISPCNIKAYSTPEVMRIKDIITKGEFSWYFNNFSPVRL